MNEDEVVLIGRELLTTAILLVAPTVIISLVVGLCISIFQTVTSIQEQTLTFAPRIMAVAIVLAVMMPWSLKIMVTFTERMFWYLAKVNM